MNNDAKLIFEAYLNKTKMLSEIPAYAAGDLDISEPKLQAAPGGGYGLKTAAAKTGKTMKQVSDELVKKIQATLFKPESHTVDGVEYNLFYPGNGMKLRNDLQNLVQKELGLGKTEANYTARIVRNMLNIVVKDDATGGVAVQADKVKSAIQAAVSSTTKTETVYEIDKAVKLADKNIKMIVNSLPDEDVGEREILGVLKAAIKEFNEAPGRGKGDMIKVKSYDLLDKLKEAGVLKEKQVEVQSKEGEGTGEVTNIDDVPEYDDVGQAAKELGYINRGRGRDPGSFSFGD